MIPHDPERLQSVRNNAVICQVVIKPNGEKNAPTPRIANEARKRGKTNANETNNQTGSVTRVSGHHVGQLGHP